MSILNGLTAPAGEGAILEVHLDIMEAPDTFLRQVKDMGFENDPFLDFFPQQYGLHYTGRTRVLQEQLPAVLPGIRETVDRILQKARAADVRLYAEIELVRNVHHFTAADAWAPSDALEQFVFEETALHKLVKADIHVEFVSGTVPPDVRALLLENCFYWVRTPASERFPSEEIATLQTSTFRGAQLVFKSLVKSPLSACTGIHLEQKLDMVASHAGLPMPPSISVTGWAREEAA